MTANEALVPTEMGHLAGEMGEMIHSFFYWTLVFLLKKGHVALSYLR